MLSPHLLVPRRHQALAAAKPVTMRPSTKAPATPLEKAPGSHPRRPIIYNRSTRRSPLHQRSERRQVAERTGTQTSSRSVKEPKQARKGTKRQREP